MGLSSSSRYNGLSSKEVIPQLHIVASSFIIIHLDKCSPPNQHHDNKYKGCNWVTKSHLNTYHRHLTHMNSVILTIPVLVEELHNESIGVKFMLLDVPCLLLPTAPPWVVPLTLLVISVVVLLLISWLVNEYISLLMYLEKQRNNKMLYGLQCQMNA